MPDWPSLDRQTITLLLRVIELPAMRIAGSVLLDQFPEAGEKMIGATLLVEDGYSAAAAAPGDHRDIPQELYWMEGTQELAHMTPSGRLSPIEMKRVTYYRVALIQCLQRWASKLMKMSTLKPSNLVTDVLWDLGEIAVGSRRRKVPIWFARRVHDRGVWSEILRMSSERVSAAPRIVLTSTSSDRAPAPPHNHVLLPITGILGTAGMIIDPRVLARTIILPDLRGGRIIKHSADFGLVTIRGQNYPFTGPKQRCIVRQLLQALEAGEPKRLTSEVLEVADFSGSVNTLAKAFSGRDAWRDFMAEANGMCWAFEPPLDRR